MSNTRKLLDLLDALDQSGATLPGEASAYLALRAAELCAGGCAIQDIVISKNGAVSSTQSASKESPLELRLLAMRCLLVSNAETTRALVAEIGAAKSAEQLAPIFETKLRPLNREAMERLLGRIAFADFENPFNSSNVQLDQWLEAH